MHLNAGNLYGGVWQFVWRSRDTAHHAGKFALSLSGRGSVLRRLLGRPIEPGNDGNASQTEGAAGFSPMAKMRLATRREMWLFYNNIFGDSFGAKI